MIYLISEISLIRKINPSLLSNMKQVITIQTIITIVIESQ